MIYYAIPGAAIRRQEMLSIHSSNNNKCVEVQSSSYHTP